MVLHGWTLLKMCLDEPYFLETSNNFYLVVHPTFIVSGGLVDPGDFNGIFVGASRPLQ